MKCPVRAVSNVIHTYLETTLNELFDNEEITSDTYSDLLSSMPSILYKSDMLKKSKIPLALEHGDFFGGNIIIQNEDPIIYDWSDCTLSHPFLSAIVLLEEVEQLFSEKVAKSLLDLYLCEWSELDSKDSLYEEYKLLEEISPIYYLTVYQTFIFPSFNDNWDKQQIIEQYIKKWSTVLQG
jgi:aminoglycoside phosphotransferase (APT) family kinase protein